MKTRNYLNNIGFLATFFIIITTLPAFVNKDNKPETRCETTRDNADQFYRPNAPFRNNLLTKDAPLIMKINVSGTVFTDCTTPLKDALIEVWQTDDNGEYDNDSKDYKYRASIKTDALGKYNFETIIPGKYMDGDKYRPSHIHFRIRSKNHQEIITQIYFKDDPYLAIDPWVSQPNGAQNILPIMEDKTGKQVVFDIYMKKLDS